MSYLKDKLKDWLFREEKERLENQRAQLEADKEDYRDEIEEEYDQKALLHLMRQKYAGFEPSLLLRDQDLFAEIEGEEAELSFLRDAKDVIENETFRRILEHMYTRQLVTSALEAKNIDAVNFGRATVNGFSLIEEELERYASMYYQRTEEEPDYDEYSVI